jgi:hypothetical protein
MYLAVALAIASPKYRDTTFSAMSIPAEMPAEVKRFPSSTKCNCLSTVVAGNSSCIQSRDRQCVVALFPLRSPALPNNRAPVQTDVKISTCLERSAIHVRTRSLPISLLVPQPPGTTSTSKFGQLLRSWAGRTFIPPVVATGSLVSATRKTSNGEGSSRRFSSTNRVTEKTSNGPQKSRTSMSSKRRMPTYFLFMRGQPPWVRAKARTARRISVNYGARRWGVPYRRPSAGGQISPNARQSCRPRSGTRRSATGAPSGPDCADRLLPGRDG